MYQIAAVAVEGFWGSYDFKVNIDPKVTFFIGQNGTGKTTLINLLAAALTADFRTLDRMPFRRVSITLTLENTPEKATITVSKLQKKERPLEQIEYRIHPGKAGSKELRFSLDEEQEEIIIRRLRDVRYSDHYRRFQTGVVAELRKLVSVNWLSVQRTSSNDRPNEARQFESSVDQKLESQSNDLVRFFATLSKAKDDEMSGFQEAFFTGLLDPPEEVKSSSFDRLKKMSSYKDALINIFSELHVTQDTSELISAFVKQADKIKKKKNPDFEDFIFLTNLERIETIVGRWERLQEKLKGIFAQRNNFQNIANQLFQKKAMSITPSNELQFVSRSGKILTPLMLSSGEKQLLILMCEALLQRQQPSIFIADEPELSLHVIWQERLISSLHSLNPNAQIIVATHSPDIVGPLAEKAVDMEELIP